MKALITAFALLSFVGVATVPYVAHAQAAQTTTQTKKKAHKKPVKRVAHKKAAKKAKKAPQA